MKNVYLFKYSDDIVFNIWILENFSNLILNLKCETVFLVNIKKLEESENFDYWFGFFWINSIQ